MDKLVIQGGHPLRGKLKVHGAKNSILPVLAASLLNCSRAEIHLKEVPAINDVRSMLQILSSLGVCIHYSGKDIFLRTDRVERYHVPDGLMREMRSGIFLIGPLLARLGRARICYPGGCAIGPRPINLHLRGLQALGATVKEWGNYIELAGRLIGRELSLDYPSVGATENLMLAAVLARGRTVIRNAAREPEIVDLQNFLNMLGAKVGGAGTETVTIVGVSALGGGCYRVFPDRIATGTFLLAAAVTRGEVLLEGVIPEHSGALIRILRECNVEVETGEHCIFVRGPETLKALPLVRTEPYPGFPTDLQAPLMVLLTLAGGTSTIAENIFRERFRHVAALNRLGAHIAVEGGIAVVKGVPFLHGAKMEATDLRAGASLVLAALAARGESEISGIHHIDRGYEKLSETLQGLGARIVRGGMIEPSRRAAP